MNEEVESFVKEKMDKLQDTPLVMQYRYFHMMEDHKEFNNENRLILEAVNSKRHFFDIIVKINKNTAIVKDVSKNPSFKNALYTVVYEGNRTGTYYESEDHALLGYLELKNLGQNSQFSYFAYKMLQE